MALEISSDQQPALDRAMNGDGSVDEVVVDPIIDHPGYREMLAGLRGLKTKVRCLHVVAIDGIAEKIDRDAWMAEALPPLSREGAGGLSSGVSSRDEKDSVGEWKGLAFHGGKACS
ncbi:hypothetical protein [Trichloromonas sp.]|uniref:hypothetical protein n=1 Tax=Trichloromonas sp. TaxID=3069249 RepID=UPI002A4B18F3|nr:hypothetical protein [Trichloromonas sp.]